MGDTSGEYTWQTHCLVALVTIFGILSAGPVSRLTWRWITAKNDQLSEEMKMPIDCNEHVKWMINERKRRVSQTVAMAMAKVMVPTDFLML